MRVIDRDDFGWFHHDCHRRLALIALMLILRSTLLYYACGRSCCVIAPSCCSYWRHNNSSSSVFSRQLIAKRGSRRYNRSPKVDPPNREELLEYDTNNDY
jgi:hypothetical protein